MATGRSKYAPESDTLLRHLHAETVVLLVVGGARGSGFSVSSTDLPSVQIELPALLRHIADQLEDPAVQS